MAESRKMQRMAHQEVTRENVEGLRKIDWNRSYAHVRGLSGVVGYQQKQDGVLVNFGLDGFEKPEGFQAFRKKKKVVEAVIVE